MTNNDAQPHSEVVCSENVLEIFAATRFIPERRPSYRPKLKTSFVCLEFQATYFDIKVNNMSFTACLSVFQLILLHITIS